MHDPVVLTDGHTYERRHIEQWLKNKNTSPVSGAQLESKRLCSNHALRNAIEEYFEQVFGNHRQAIQQAIRQTVAGLRRGKRRVSDELMIAIDSLMQCSVLVNADLCLEQVLKRIMDEARSLVGAEVASVFILDHEQQELYSTINSTGGELRIPITSGIAGRVATSGIPLIVRDAYCDENFNAQIDAETGFKTRDIMCVPVQSWKWGMIGVAELINKTDYGVLTSVGSLGSCSSSSGSSRDGPAGANTPASPTKPDVLHFTEEDQHFFQVLASQAAVAIVNSGLFDFGVSGHVRLSKSVTTSSANTKKEKKTANRVNDSTDSERSKLDTSGGLGAASSAPTPPQNPAPPPKAATVETAEREDESGHRRPSKSFDGKCNSPIEKLGSAGRVRVLPLLMEARDGWEVDCLDLMELSDNRPLSVICFHLVGELGLIRYFDIDKMKLTRFLEDIERGYSTEVPYHNRAHAASVVHFMYALLKFGGVSKASCAVFTTVEDIERAQKLVELAGLFAAMVHDYEHVGLSNDYLIKDGSPQALRYNDKSPNENHHVASAFVTLHKPESNFLDFLSHAEYREFRNVVIELVLATDMARTGESLDRFKTAVEKWEAEAEEEDGAAGRDFVPTEPADALVTLQLTLKCADIGHLALGWHSHVRWVRRLESEFFSQGDKEKASAKHGEVSFLMDREKPGVSQTQVGFFTFVVMPLYRALVDAFPGCDPMLQKVEANYGRWQEIEKAIKEEVLE